MKLDYPSRKLLNRQIHEKIVDDVEPLIAGMKGAKVTRKATSEAPEVGERENEQFDVSCISREVVDHEGDVILLSGLDVSVFEKNPIVLFNHSEASPIGKAAWLKVDGDRLLMKTIYAKNDDTSQKVFNLTKQKILVGKSIGFLAKDSRPPSREELEKYGDGCRKVITNSILLEVSCVAVPCNSEALLEMVSKGFVPPKGLEMPTKQSIKVAYIPPKKRKNILGKAAKYI